MSDDVVDVLIIGAGASGAAFAWSMADTRMRIVCLEQGDWMKQSDYATNTRHWERQQWDTFNIDPNIRKGEADYPINDDESPISVVNFNGVGGGTILYAAHFRPEISVMVWAACQAAEDLYPRIHSCWLTEGFRAIRRERDLHKEKRALDITFRLPGDMRPTKVEYEAIASLRESGTLTCTGFLKSYCQKLCS